VSGLGDYGRAPCSLGLARELLADAWALHEEIGRPIPSSMFIYLPYFGPEPVEPRRRKPNLGAYMTETMVQSADLVRGSDELVAFPHYGTLSFSSEAAYRFTERCAPKRGPAKLSKRNRERFIREVASAERGRLIRRMAVNLEVEALAGRATRPVNQLAAQTWLALNERVCPMEEVPFVWDLAAESTALIVQNLRDGYRNAEEAKQAAFEMMDELYEVIDSLMEDAEDELRW